MSNRIEQLQATHPDQALALAVLEQALRDAVGGVTACCSSHDVREAREFLTDQAGQWRHARRVWCDQAGINPDYFERRMLLLKQAGKI